MGSEQSQQTADVQIDPQCVETTDYWSLFNGELPIGNGSLKSVTLFQGEPVVPGQLWTSQSPLERAAKVCEFEDTEMFHLIKEFACQNLMIYRHPSILKFINTYARGSHRILVTERCKPLSIVLAVQSDVQICLGLRTILCSLVFLIEQVGF